MVQTTSPPSDFQNAVSSLVITHSRCSINTSLDGWMNGGETGGWVDAVLALFWVLEIQC